MVVLFFLATLWQTDSADVVRDKWHGVLHGVGSSAPNTGPVAGGIPIRLMFVGASMTLGEHSTGEVGYRKQIRDWLVDLGNPVNCVGANRYGDFKDNDVQAFGAQPIKPTLDRAREIVPETQPNLILINAGSSDCFQQDHWGSKDVITHMRELVDFLLEASPRATVILSTVITCPWADNCVKSANAQIRQVAIDLERLGKPIAMAEMHYDQGLPGRPNRTDIGKDNMHPTDEGYFMMGRIFMEKIREVEARGFLQPPVENGIMDDGNAERDIENAKKAQEEAKKAQEEGKISEEETLPVDNSEPGPKRRSHFHGRVNVP